MDETAPTKLWELNRTRTLLFILIGTSLLVRSQPWRQMTSTLLVDIVFGVLKGLLPKINLWSQASGSDLGIGFGTSNILGHLNYNPASDPYYITNLDAPIDEFFTDALEGIQFTNVVQLVLESMRADSFPFKERSLFMDYIRENFPLPVNGTPITTSNVTPFIASLAEHTISWETMWTVVPFTHKALLGRTTTIPCQANERLLRTAGVAHGLDR